MTIDQLNKSINQLNAYTLLEFRSRHESTHSYSLLYICTKQQSRTEQNWTQNKIKDGKTLAGPFRSACPCCVNNVDKMCSHYTSHCTSYCGAAVAASNFHCGREIFASFASVSAIIRKEKLKKVNSMDAIHKHRMKEEKKRESGKKRE